MATQIIELTGDWQDITTLASLAASSTYVLGNTGSSYIFTQELGSTPTDNEVGKVIPPRDERGFQQGSDNLWARCENKNSKVSLSIDSAT